MRGTHIYNSLLCGLLLVAAAPAQEGGRQLPSEDSPIRVSGMEQGNNFRARTPALMRSDRKIKKVDREELYKRRLAAYQPAPAPMAETAIVQVEPDEAQQARTRTKALAERTRRVRAERMNTIMWIGIGFVPLLLGIGLMVKRAGYLSPPSP